MLAPSKQSEAVVSMTVLNLNQRLNQSFSQPPMKNNLKDMQSSESSVVSPGIVETTIEERAMKNAEELDRRCSEALLRNSRVKSGGLNNNGSSSPNSRSTGISFSVDSLLADTRPKKSSTTTNNLIDNNNETDRLIRRSSLEDLRSRLYLDSLHAKSSPSPSRTRLSSPEEELMKQEEVDDIDMESGLEDEDEGSLVDVVALRDSESLRNSGANSPGGDDNSRGSSPATLHPFQHSSNPANLMAAARLMFGPHSTTPIRPTPYNSALAAAAAAYAGVHQHPASWPGHYPGSQMFSGFGSALGGSPGMYTE